MGEGVNSWVMALTTLADGTVIAGGSLTTADGEVSSRWARWVSRHSADFDGDGSVATDADIDAFFRCLAGNCCARCGSSDFDGDGIFGTDLDIEAFFRALAGGPC
jgi:hypothetical protein